MGIRSNPNCAQLKTNGSPPLIMPSPCPICLGSGVNINQGGFPGIRSGTAAKCNRCDGKGWLDNEPEPDSINDVEVQLVLAALQEHGELNIDDMVRLTGLDIPQAYRALQSLRDKGSVELRGTSPIQYFISKPKG
jgi:hypothetical protein